MSLFGKRTAVLWFLLAVVFLSGCASRATATRLAPTPTVLTATFVVPTPTSLASPTVVPTPRPTATPTHTPPSEPTVAASSTPSPSPTGKASVQEEGGTEVVRFARDIAPIFQQRCVKCHAGTNPPRGLRLDTYENVLKGGDFRPVVIPGDPEGSELVRRIRGDSTPRMPFDGPPFLSDEEIAKIIIWIEEGAPDN